MTEVFDLRNWEDTVVILLMQKEQFEEFNLVLLSGAA
jgi:hypothetical protein